MSRRILVVAAHPDDEVLGCGGTMIKEVAQGSEVYCVILGKGITSRSVFDSTDLTKLMESCDQANALIGVKDKWVLDYPDNQYDTVPLLEVVKSIECIKTMIQPDVVFTHHQNDLNIDHQVAFMATLTACRPVSGESVRGLYSFYIPSSTEWGVGGFEPNLYVDITATIDQKLKVLDCYAGELRTSPHPRSIEGIKAFTQYYGSIVCVEHAEPFKVIRVQA